MDSSDDDEADYFEQTLSPEHQVLENDVSQNATSGSMNDISGSTNDISSEYISSIPPTNVSSESADCQIASGGLVLPEVASTDFHSDISPLQQKVAAQQEVAAALECAGGRPRRERNLPTKLKDYDLSGGRKKKEDKGKERKKKR